jgi:hypothetical protein
VSPRGARFTIAVPAPHRDDEPAAEIA